MQFLCLPKKKKSGISDEVAWNHHKGLSVQWTRTPTWVVSEDMERNVFMSTTNAQAHGNFDHVWVE